MTLLGTDPIREHWNVAESPAVDGQATAVDVARRLALLEMDQVDATLVPLLAAAAAELALATGIPWRRSDDDPPVALLRLVAKVAARNPTAGGPHTARLLDQLP